MPDSRIEQKKNVLYIALTLIFIILALQFYKLQISETSLYAEKSFENSVKIVTQFPVRGNIYDRDGRMIVHAPVPKSLSSEFRRSPCSRGIPAHPWIEAGR